MKAKRLYPVLLAAVLVGTSGWGLAAQGDASTHPQPQTEQGTKTMPGMNTQMMGNMGNGMMGQGMMGHGMMRHGMMGGMMGMMGGGCPMMGQLPAGHEALAMRMHGEMMEAMGRILVKYADKLEPQQSK